MIFLPKKEMDGRIVSLRKQYPNIDVRSYFRTPKNGNSVNRKQIDGAIVSPSFPFGLNNVVIPFGIKSVFFSQIGGNRVAIKVVYKKAEHDIEGPGYNIHQCEALQSVYLNTLDMRNIVKIEWIITYDIPLDLPSSIFRDVPSQELESGEFNYIFVNELVPLTFYDLLKKKKVSDEEIIKVVWQVLFTVAEIQSMEPTFRHNDLHGDNILIQELPEEEELTYLDGEITIRSKYIAKICDFEFAHSKTISNRYVLNGSLEPWGIVDTYCPIYDVHTTIKSIFIHRDSKVLRGFASDVLRIFRELKFTPTMVLERINLTCKEGSRLSSRFQEYMVKSLWEEEKFDLGKYLERVYRDRQASLQLPLTE